MSIKNSRIGAIGCLIMATIFSILLFLLAEHTAAKEASNSETTDAESTDKTQVPPATPIDEYHRGTPRVYFNEFNRDSLNIIVLFWYHSEDYWAFMALCQRVNRQIMHEFEQAGIQFALPSHTVYAEPTAALRS
jgi:MscS family membrane protein